MTLLADLIIVSETYCAATSLSRSRVSTLVLKGGRRMDDVAAGRSDITTGTFERAMQWFSDHWPAEAAWPDDVSRPPASSFAGQRAADGYGPDQKPIEIGQ